MGPLRPATYFYSLCNITFVYLRQLSSLPALSLPASRGVSTKAPNYCIVMEYCGEGSLYEVIQKRTEILPPEVIKWAGQIASGMHFLHSKKIIHRDLKSAK